MKGVVPFFSVFEPYAGDGFVGVVHDQNAIVQRIGHGKNAVHASVHTLVSYQACL